MLIFAIFGIWRRSWGSVNLTVSELLYEHYAEAMLYELNHRFPVSELLSELTYTGNALRVNSGLPLTSRDLLGRSSTPPGATWTRNDQITKKWGYQGGQFPAIIKLS